MKVHVVSCFGIHAVGRKASSSLTLSSSAYSVLWTRYPRETTSFLPGGGFCLGLSSRCQLHAGLQDYSNNSVPSFHQNQRAPIFYFLQSLPLKPPRPPPHHSLCSQVKLCVAWCCMQCLLINQCD